MSERRKKDRLNETWTKDELSKSLKGSDKSSHRGEKHSRRSDRNDEEKYRKREKRKEERIRDEEQYNSRTDHYRDKEERRRRDRKERERKENDHRENRRNRDDQYYTLNGEDRKHRKEYEESSVRRSKKSDRKNKEDEDERRRRKEERQSSAKKYSDDDRRRHKGEDSHHHQRDRKKDEWKHHRDEEDSRLTRREEDEDERHRRKKDEQRHQKREERHEEERSSHRERRREDRHQDEERRQKRNNRRRKEETEEERWERKERHRREREEHERKKMQEQNKEKHREKTHRSQREELSEKHDKETPVKEKKPDYDDDEYNYDDEEFEDYADDFENESEGEPDLHPEMPDSYKPSEMDELMKAIAAENERANSAQTSSRFGSTMTSDRNDSPLSAQDSSSSDVRDTYSSSKVEVSGATINFMAAKSSTAFDKTKKRMLKRSQDLMNLIQLDTISFDLIDMPPVTEYNLYIKNFGNSNTSQVSTQCGDDNLERETQTEVTEKLKRWTQHPPHDRKCCGGEQATSVDEVSENEERERILAVMRGDSKRLGKFLSKACKLMEMIIIEDELWIKSMSKSNVKSQLSFCENYVSLQTNLPYLQGRKVVHVECSPSSDVNLIAVAFEPAANGYSTRMDRKGLISVWDTRKPQVPEKILVCDATPTCCCFSLNRSHVLFVGTEDGCVLAYDLREPGCNHQVVSIDATNETILRSPTYTTGYLTEGHSSPLVCLTPVESSSPVRETTSNNQSEQVNSGLAFQLASLEEAANLCIWIVVEKLSDLESDDDYGLSPCGRIKLLKSLCIKVKPPMKSPISDVGLHSTCTTLRPCR